VFRREAATASVLTSRIEFETAVPAQTHAERSRRRT